MKLPIVEKNIAIGEILGCVLIWICAYSNLVSKKLIAYLYKKLQLSCALLSDNRILLPNNYKSTGELIHNIFLAQQEQGRIIQMLLENKTRQDTEITALKERLASLERSS